MWHVFKIFIRLMAYCAEFIFGFVAIYLTIVVFASLIPVEGEEGQHDVRIFIKTNGVHTDICVPVVTDEMDWRSFIPLSDYPSVKDPVYLSVGWGDKGFFLDTPTWADLKFSTAFNAAFTGSETAMHVAYHENEPGETGTCRGKWISSSKYRDLVGYVRNSFQTGSKGVRLIPGKGYWANDNFYEANGAYHLFNTCNAWTNQGLKIAGVRTALLALFSDGIMRHLE